MSYTQQAGRLLRDDMASLIEILWNMTEASRSRISEAQDDKTAIIKLLLEETRAQQRENAAALAQVHSQQAETLRRHSESFNDTLKELAEAQNRSRESLGRDVLQLCNQAISLEVESTNRRSSTVVQHVLEQQRNTFEILMQRTQMQLLEQDSRLHERMMEAARLTAPVLQQNQFQRSDVISITEQISSLNNALTLMARNVQDCCQGQAHVLQLQSRLDEHIQQQGQATLAWGEEFYNFHRALLPLCEGIQQQVLESNACLRPVTETIQYYMSKQSESCADMLSGIEERCSARFAQVVTPLVAQFRADITLLQRNHSDVMKREISTAVFKAILRGESRNHAIMIQSSEMRQQVLTIIPGQTLNPSPTATSPAPAAPIVTEPEEEIPTATKKKMNRVESVPRESSPDPSRPEPPVNQL